MRFVLTLAAGALALLGLTAVGLLADAALNRHRLLYAILGRDKLVAACLPELTGKLREAGFEPTDVEFGAFPAMSLSTAFGRSIEDDFTFADGPSQTRVDGAMACSVEGGRVSVRVQTETTPTRAT